jgi:hypothetical protein
MTRLNLLLLILWILLPCKAHSQDTKLSDFDLMVQKSKGRDLEDTHRLLESICNTEEQKARAFFVWIAHNIKYDVPELYNSSGNYEKQEAAQVFKTRKGVCQGYSNLFLEFCKLSGIECQIAVGHVRQEGIYQPYGHAWNVIRIDGKWRLIDATWGAGVIDNSKTYRKLFDDRYFMGDPAFFIQEHYPFDPIWQLMENPIKLEEFKKQSLNGITSNNTYKYSYNDTITQWLALDSAHALMACAKRMMDFNPGAKAIREEAQILLFNAAGMFLSAGSDFLDDLNEDIEGSTRKKVKEFYGKAQACVAMMGTIPADMKNEVDELKKIIRHNLSIMESVKSNPSE